MPTPSTETVEVPAPAGTAQKAAGDGTAPSLETVEVPRRSSRGRALAVGLFLAVLAAGVAHAAPAAAPAASPSAVPHGASTLHISFGDGSRQEWVLGLRLLGALTVLSLAPALLILTTSFTRIVIVLSFLRNGLGLNQTPATQLLVAYALFLTFLIMKPVWAEVQTKALTPYAEGTITWSDAVDQGGRPLRDFMLRHTRSSDLVLFYELAQRARPARPEDVSLDVLLAAYVTSELRVAFQMGFALLIPFLVIDLVVASILTSMGMMMLPPVMIAMPFKVLVFVLVDGWALLARALVSSFH